NHLRRSRVRCSRFTTEPIDCVVRTLSSWERSGRGGFRVSAGMLELTYTGLQAVQEVGRGWDGAGWDSQGAKAVKVAAYGGDEAIPLAGFHQEARVIGAV